MIQKRFSSADWLDLGFQQLKHHNALSMTVESLCERAGKTRGSFYFHFESMEGYLEALANEWQLRFTDQIIAAAPDSVSRLDLLNQLAGRLDPAIETGIRQLALSNPSLQAIVAQADQQRISWLADLYQASGRYSKNHAERLAEIEYAAFVGFRLVNPDLSSAQARDLYQAFLELTDRAQPHP